MNGFFTWQACLKVRLVRQQEHQKVSRIQPFILSLIHPASDKFLLHLCIEQNGTDHEKSNSCHADDP
jgi:hypothetical protein